MLLLSQLHNTQVELKQADWSFNHHRNNMLNINSGTSVAEAAVKDLWGDH